jgi:alpha-L-fucosidase
MRPSEVRWQVVLLVAIGLTAAAAEEKPAENFPYATGPFRPTYKSLEQYQCPDWFRDAKFGIWSCWGPQSVPMEGDWYARNIYVQGSTQYNYHVKHYGHPSKVGYKDIIPLWKAEKWDPERLMALYKKAGARYFVTIASHHDNFHLWNSKEHRWNAVNMGPKRDVVGQWQQAAKKAGMRFGVSDRLSASFWWFQPSHGADKTGPLAGVPYDGTNPKWWDLYHRPAPPGDGKWFSHDSKWQETWYRQIKDLVDNYQPDLLYTDGGVPFGQSDKGEDDTEAGRHMIAHFYNTNAARNHGICQAVYNCKQDSQGLWVEDLERGVMGRVRAMPWQTDTSIADWYYNRHWKTRNAEWVLRTLVDVVSKNGNLLLNVVQRPDGSLDADAEQLLAELAAWTATNGEAIFDTRPWVVYGEGPMQTKGGSFHEDFTFGPKDVRFTTKGDATLYAFGMVAPDDGQMVIRSLAKSADGKTNVIERISLLGSREKLAWTQTADGLTVTLPVTKLEPVAPPEKPREKADAKPPAKPAAAPAAKQPEHRDASDVKLPALKPVLGQYPFVLKIIGARFQPPRTEPARPATPTGKEPTKPKHE